MLEFSDTPPIRLGAAGEAAVSPRERFSDKRLNYDAIHELRSTNKNGSLSRVADPLRSGATFMVSAFADSTCRNPVTSSFLRTMVNSDGVGDSLEMAIFEQIRHGRTLLRGSTSEEIATDLHRRAKSHDAAGLAATAGCRLRLHSHEEVGAVMLSDGVIAVYRGTEPRGRELAILHGIALWLLRRRPHSPADAWRLALALAMPLPLPAAITAADVYPTARIPLWAIRARVSMPTNPSL